VSSLAGIQSTSAGAAERRDDDQRAEGQDLGVRVLWRNVYRRSEIVGWDEITNYLYIYPFAVCWLLAGAGWLPVVGVLGGAGQA